MLSKKGVELRMKEFLGLYEGKMYGTFKYPGASVGRSKGN